jgi:hypothetical protein
MVDAVGSLLKLQRTILTWDYYSLAAKAEEGGGPFDNLRRVPSTFKDIQVGGVHNSYHNLTVTVAVEGALMSPST